jgi:type IV secretory pathway VirB2 component (pilin)
MITTTTIQLASLTDPPPASAIAAASSWVSDLLFGPLANALAVIAMAWVGFAMLSGRVNIRRGLGVVLGCFLLFGARGIADSLGAVALSDELPTRLDAPPRPVFAKTGPPEGNPNGFDPYAGAAVPGG